MKPWEKLDARPLHRGGVFNLEEVRFRHPDRAEPRGFCVLDAPDWINIIPLTLAGRVVMVRQYRFGVEGFTLEIPGGMCDPGEAPLAAARREMLEESGHDSDDIVPIGWLHPNPAIQTNRCHSFLARNALQVAPPRPDPDEMFEVTDVALEDVPGLIADGTITHSLVVGAFYLLNNAGHAVARRGP